MRPRVLVEVPPVELAQREFLKRFVEDASEVKFIPGEPTKHWSFHFHPQLTDLVKQQLDVIRDQYTKRCSEDVPTLTFLAHAVDDQPNRMVVLAVENFVAGEGSITFLQLDEIVGHTVDRIASDMKKHDHV